MNYLPYITFSASPTLKLFAHRIIAFQSLDSFQARELLKNERQAETLINGCGSLKAKTAIILDNGSVASSPYSANRMTKEIESKITEIINAKKIKDSGTQKQYDPEDIEEPDYDAAIEEMSDDDTNSI